MVKDDASRPLQAVSLTTDFNYCAPAALGGSITLASASLQSEAALLALPFLFATAADVAVCLTELVDHLLLIAIA